MEKAHRGMDIEESQGRKPQVLPTSEEGFDIATCFENRGALDTYVPDADYYFDSYSHFGIHEEMLKDKVRTEGYRKAIVDNVHLFKDKIVLDVGCGTGILSIFAAKAGAKHVYAVENANIAKHAQDIIRENNLTEKITVIKSKIEEAELPVPKVDIIISEWMGYFLLYESMLDSILFARDKWLNEGGIMLPDRATLWIASIEDEEYKNKKIHFWDNVYGVKMSCIKKWAMFEPLVDNVDSQSINSDSCCILDIDLSKVKIEDLDFSASYTLNIKRKDSIHAIVSWFEVHFSHAHTPLRISTSPYMKETHWKQTTFYLNEVLKVFKNDQLHGSIAVKKSKKNPRELDIKISYHTRNNIQDHHSVQFYKLC